VVVEEGLREVENLCVMGLAHGQNGEVVARPVPQPDRLQQELLQALDLE